MTAEARLKLEIEIAHLAAQYASANDPEQKFRLLILINEMRRKRGA
jgi:hypothetical protein